MPVTLALVIESAEGLGKDAFYTQAMLETERQMAKERHVEGPGSAIPEHAGLRRARDRILACVDEVPTSC